MKASAGYIGAGLIHYDCYFMQDFFAKKDYTAMCQRYNRLIEDSCEFIQYSKEFMLINEEDKEIVQQLDLKDVNI